MRHCELENCLNEMGGFVGEYGCNVGWHNSKGEAYAKVAKRAAGVG